MDKTINHINNRTKYDIYVDNVKVASYDNYWDAAISKVFWKIIFGIEVVVVENK